jgi:hypothetical protein
VLPADVCVRRKPFDGSTILALDIARGPKLEPACFARAEIGSLVIGGNDCLLPHDAFRMCAITNGEVVVPETVVEIQSRCFFGAQFAVFDASRSNIAAFAESLCEGATVEKVVVPDSVQVFERRCFANCAALREVVFGRGSKLAEIREFAFERSGLPVFTFPLTLKSVHGTAFANLTVKIEFKIDRNHPVFCFDPRKVFLCGKLKDVGEFGVPNS